MRRGVSLIEVLCVIVIIGILAMLLVPAVVSSRSAARRLKCANNLKQIGIAFNAYTANHGFFPAASNPMQQSFFMILLPYLDHNELYNSFNHNVKFRGHPAQLTGRSTQISTFICPADGSALGGTKTSYGGNTGSMYVRGKSFRKDGLLCEYSLSGGSFVSVSSVSDGLSNTAAMAEWLVHDLHGSSSHRRSVFVDPVDGPPLNTDMFAIQCKSSSRFVSVESSSLVKGIKWTSGHWGYGLYDHLLPPNHRSCRNPEALVEVFGTANPSSEHEGGVNVLFGDGRVKLIRDGIESNVWKALGSRDGGEVNVNVEF